LYAKSIRLVSLSFFFGFVPYFAEKKKSSNFNRNHFPSHAPSKWWENEIACWQKRSWKYAKEMFGFENPDV